jgi:hypothetical protein
VLVLDKAGHVVKQGPPDKITISEDFIHPASSEGQDTIADKQDGVLSTNKEGIGAQGLGSSDGMDQQRQIGDLSVYKFYFSSLGWPSLVIFAGAVVASSVFATLGCMGPSSRHPQSIRGDQFLTNNYRCLDYFVVSTQRAWWQL